MCYNIAGLQLRKLKLALRDNLSEEEIKEIEKEYERLRKIYEESKELYYANAFQFPFLCTILKDNSKYKVEFCKWGLIPHWAKTFDQANDIRKKTLNCRSETMFDKPSFRHSATKKRCIVMVDGFYEYYHHNKKTFPFLIEMSNDSPMSLGGLYQDWTDTETGEVHRTITIVTTKPNNTMSKIHNNPKRSEGRMPVILAPEDFETWLKNEGSLEDKEKTLALAIPFSQEKLSYKTVPKLVGKMGVGNSPDSRVFEDYSELKDIDWITTVIKNRD